MPPTALSAHAPPADISVAPIAADPTLAVDAPIAPAIDLYSRPNDWGLLAALSLSHFFNDFCLGIAAPMIPTLERKFDLTLGGVAGILIITSLVGNFTQPVAGWAMERSRTARVLLLCPFLCALTFLLGFTTETWHARVLFFVAGAANGMFHPFSFLLAQLALPRRPAFSTAIFISFGFLGVSSGAMVSGHWMEGFGFQGFHWLYLGAIVTAAVLVWQGTQRIQLAPYLSFIHPPRSSSARLSEAEASRRRIPFGLLWLVGFLMAFEGGTVMFFTPKLFKLLYGSEGLGGDACFVYGVVGGAASYLYANWADKGSAFKIAMFAQLAALAPLAGFFWLGPAIGKLAMITLIGATGGATLPLITSLARGSRGLTVGLRSSLMLGGTWGAVSIVHWAMAQLPDRGYSLGAVMASICAAPLLIAPALLYAWRRYET